MRWLIKVSSFEKALKLSRKLVHNVIWHQQKKNHSVWWTGVPAWCRNKMLEKFPHLILCNRFSSGKGKRRPGRICWPWALDAEWITVLNTNLPLKTCPFGGGQKSFPMPWMNFCSWFRVAKWHFLLLLAATLMTVKQYAKQSRPHYPTP